MFNMESLREIIGREVTIGFGRNEYKEVNINRIVVLYEGFNNGGLTIYAGDKEMTLAEREEMKATITSQEVKCDELLLKKNIICFQSGRNRMLSVSYTGKDDLHVVYLPDKSDLENNNSEFLKRAGNRGF